jgi:hypothetical protein
MIMIDELISGDPGSLQVDDKADRFAASLLQGLSRFKKTCFQVFVLTVDSHNERLVYFL